METIKTQKDILLKSGATIPKGTYMDWIGTYTNPVTGETKHRIGVFNLRGKEMKLSYPGVFKAPSWKTLDRWVMNGVAEDVIHGENIEPDGVTHDGSPSWLLVMGMI